MLPAHLSPGAGLGRLTHASAAMNRPRNSSLRHGKSRQQTSGNPDSGLRERAFRHFLEEGVFKPLCLTKTHWTLCSTNFETSTSLSRIGRKSSATLTWAWQGWTAESRSAPSTLAWPSWCSATTPASKPTLLSGQYTASGPGIGAAFLSRLRQTIPTPPGLLRFLKAAQDALPLCIQSTPLIFADARRYDDPIVPDGSEPR